MTNWTRLLEEVIPRPCFVRPLVCNGFPGDSTVIIIGENPATATQLDWWSYWSDAKGFDLSTFMGRYRNQREEAGKRTKLSPTRARLARFREKKVRCIETNAFSNERQDGADDGISNLDVLRQLIDNMPNLSAVIAHGAKAHDCLDEIEADNLLPARIAHFRTKHFRSLSYADVDRLCAELSTQI